MELVVTRTTREAEGVRGFDLRRADATPLPVFTAGAHIDLHLPNGLTRQYSLLNDPRERHRYCLGISLPADSRGGSRYLHEHVKAGDRLTAGQPRSLFAIDAAAAEHVFIAGGIGITPFMSMIRWCEAHGQRWRLLYCVRSRARAAFLWDLAAYHERVLLYVDEDAGEGHPDLRGFLSDAPAASHVYCCGPAPQMQAVAAAAAGLGIDAGAVHFERFSAGQLAPTDGGDRPFDIVLQRHGGHFTVPPGATILETLERNGLSMPFSCREGLCRACEVPMLAGKADHRDSVLSQAERNAHTSIMPCISRAVSGELVLDI
ncbi:PDR/VanB family oxidoreductase [Roseateles toxinivorans]|nr:PDR/VanB family oxidoreductase [Roseateles toxinivorans]